MLKRFVLLVVITAMVLITCGAAPGTSPSAAPNPHVEPVPSWIWGKAEATDGQVLRFRRSFELRLPKTPAADPKAKRVEAALWATADNEMTIWLNGSDIAESVEWGQPVSVDVSKLLVDGKNVLVARCKNIDSAAGLIVRLDVTMPDGHTTSIISDNAWRVSSEAPRRWNAIEFDDSAWPQARALARYGEEPWGVLGAAEPYVAGALAAEKLYVTPGFKAELIYSVPKLTEGSWVSMTPDPKGRLYVSDQFGPLYRITPGKGSIDTRVEKLDLPIGAAQGLLWAYDSLYVIINGGHAGRTSGMYRLRDTDGDDVLDKIDDLKAFKDRNNNGPVGGEHGPHAILPGPDEKLYVVAGNFTNVPDDILPTSPAARWAEDLLLERAPDGRGHDPNIMAPGGWIARCDRDGKNWELITVGMRNAYDMAFNPAGELFAYDSDMEWDIGAPWYRPTRIAHITSGAEWGWRNGSGKWPTYYPDSLPPVVDTGIGSPTGVTMGTGSKFPAKYQHALFAADWAYGKIYAVHLKPSGSSYTATYEPFVSGKPFGVTDVVINPHDGAMYVTTGGRKTQSGMYRITYVGDESTAPIAPVDDPAAKDARALRHKLESFHGKRDSQAVSLAFANIGHADRFIRYAARLALEFQDPSQWQTQAVAPASSPTAAINALVALCRVGDKLLQPRVLEALDRLEFTSLTKEQKLELLRAYGLCFIRMGRPGEPALARYAKRWEPLFPAGDVDIDHELAQLLVYTDAPRIIEKSLALVEKSQTQEEQLFYAFILRHMRNHWTPTQRNTYFTWLRHAEENYRGGASFTLFIQHMRDEAVATLKADEKLALGKLTEHSGGKRTKPDKAQPPRKFVRNWTMKELVPVLDRAGSGRNFAKGKAAFEATACLTCHRFKSDGGAAGPDITGAGARFSANDLLEAILEPSKVISDQYQAIEFVSKNDVVSGTIMSEDADTIVVRPSALSNATVKVNKKTLVSRRPSKLSTMPAGLIDVLSEDEILDLLAYIRAAGDSNDRAFQKVRAPAPLSDAAP